MPNAHRRRDATIELRRVGGVYWTLGPITSKIKHKTSPARLAQLLQPSLAFCFSLQPMTFGCKLMLMRAATVVQVLQDLFYVLLHVLFYLWLLLYYIYEQVDPCYDQDGTGGARRCAPDFVNAAFGREIRASSTCGEFGPSRYCLPSGTTWRTSSSTSSSSCHVCDATDVKLSHSASHLTDLNNPNNVTCWLSEPTPASASNNVSLTLSLGKKFEVQLLGS